MLRQQDSLFGVTSLDRIQNSDPLVALLPLLGEQLAELALLRLMLALVSFWKMKPVETINLSHHDLLRF